MQSIVIIVLFLLLIGVGAMTMNAQIKKTKESLAKSEERIKYLEQSSAAKTSMMTNMSYDIRTPINNILGMVALARKEENTDKTNACLEKIEIESKRVFSLVNDMLDMNSIEEGKMSFDTHPMSLNSVAYDCLETFKGRLGNHKIAVIGNLDEISEPLLNVDELHLRQIILNIMTNSVRYLDKGGKIELDMSELSKDNEKVYVRFEISDNGPGIQPEILEHLFDSSVQYAVNRKSYRSTGLGMPITKNLIELMGGVISVKSEVGNGAKFTFDIPFSIAEASDLTANVDISSDISGARILLVEDNELNRDVARELLTGEGAIVDCASDGLEAVKMFEDSMVGSYEVILMDITMPNMDGYEATRAIRALPRTDAGLVPIVAMTANAFPEDISAAMDAGMNAHLSKPVDVAKMINTISKYYVKSIY